MLFTSRLGKGNELDDAIERYPEIPQNLLEGLYGYVTQHIKTGGFLYAVLTNDLNEACSRADRFSSQVLIELVQFCNMEIPSDCWGSEEDVTEWLKRRKVE